MQNKKQTKSINVFACAHECTLTKNYINKMMGYKKNPNKSQNEQTHSTKTIATQIQQQQQKCNNKNATTKAITQNTIRNATARKS